MKMRPKYAAVVTFILSFSLFIAITFAYIQNKSDMEHAKMEQLLFAKSTKVNNVITKLLYKTQILSAVIVQSGGDVQGFAKIAGSIMDDPAIKNFIIAPQGVVTKVYPIEGNEGVLGLDYFSAGAGNKEAVEARQKGELVLGGPFELVQGGEAIVGRMPVYTTVNDGKKFWGIVSVTLKYPEALEAAELRNLDTQGFAYEIWRISPDTGQRQVIAHSEYDYNKKAKYIEMPLKILNAEWNFRLSPIKLWYQHPETWILVGIGFFISLLLASLVVHNQDLKKIKSELEEISNIDSLTGTLNRRGIFNYLDKLVTQPDAKFTLCYIDINKFKLINDSYGHLTGDTALKKVVDMLNIHLSKEQKLGRIGGDEFIVIFEDDISDEDLQNFFSLIREKLKKTIPVEKQKYLDISFSFGKAVYPDDADNIDELVKCADTRMYKDKYKIQ